MELMSKAVASKSPARTVYVTVPELIGLLLLSTPSTIVVISRVSARLEFNTRSIVPVNVTTSLNCAVISVVSPSAKTPSSGSAVILTKVGKTPSTEITETLFRLLRAGISNPDPVMLFPALSAILPPPPTAIVLIVK